MVPLPDQLRRRHVALAALRGFFQEEGFLEVETPMLVPGPGLEPHIDPLEVRVRPGLHQEPERRWLHTSPELALKRVVASGARSGEGGLSRVFQVARVFRDGERTPLHWPEFTLVEWYRAQGALDDLVADCEQLFARVRDALLEVAPASTPRALVGVPFERTTVAALFDQAGIDLGAALDETAAGDPTALARRARAAGQHVRAEGTFEDAFFHVMGTLEPTLGTVQPVVVERWPRSMAVLARLCDDDPRYAARFEVYADGVELANAFDELTDPIEQRARFEEDNRHRRALGKPQLPLDEEFLRDLKDLPRTSGIALGFDRMLMVLLGERTIDDVAGLSWR